MNDGVKQGSMDTGRDHKRHKHQVPWRAPPSYKFFGGGMS